MTRGRLLRRKSSSPLGGLLALVCVTSVPPASVAAVEACPVPPTTRSAYPRRILAPGQQPWSLRPLPSEPAPLPAATLPPSRSAERRHLIRRLTFLLTGLPPRADDAEAFSVDESPRALGKVIDRLQASPAAAERLAHWWLDLVEYVDRWTELRSESCQPTLAWRYRDWIVEGFEESTRLSQFLRLHLIGDTMAGPGPGLPNRPGLTATTWFLFGPAPRGDLAGASAALASHQAERTARFFLGADFSCARCHDHPALPLRVDDHASWVSVFSQHHSLVARPDGSLALAERPTVSAKRLAQRKTELGVIAELEKKRDSLHREFSLSAGEEFLPQTAEYVRAAWAWHRQPQGTAEAFCAQRGLLAAPFHRWLATLGLSEPSSSASSQSWWKTWDAARASGEPGRIAHAAQQIQSAHLVDESSPFFDLSSDALSLLTLDQQTQLSKLEKRIAELHQKLTSDQTVHAIAEGPAPGTAVPAVPARLPALLLGAPPGDLHPPSSGRRALSAWLDGAGRPLLTRLLAHRLWVACGQRPLMAHELDLWRPEPPPDVNRLETLAAALEAGNGSLAPLQKQILFAAPGGEPLTLSDAERRDAVLFVSGQLDPRPHGPPDASAASRRRSLYRAWIHPRKPAPLLGTFLQAQAEATVRLATENAGPSPTARTDWLTHRILQRPPSDQERRELGDAPDHQALVAFCLTLFQSDEFRVLR